MSTSLVPFGFSSGLMDDFRREVDTLVNRFFQPDAGSAEMARWSPRLNLAETEHGYEVSVDLPGLKAEDIDIELKHGDLWITGSRTSEQEESGKTWHRVERFQGEFRRVIRLGDDVDPEKVTAEYREGVLHVSIPKTETAKTKRITVQAK